MRIVWTKEEKRALRDCMIDICFVTPTMSNKVLLRKAQEEVIPYERRHVITDQRVFTYKTMMAEARKAAEDHRAKTSKPKDVPLPKPVPEPPPLKIDTLGNLFELLVDAITDRVLEKLKAQVETPEPAPAAEQGFGNAWLDKLDSLTIRRKEVKVKRPTVLVVGLNGVQMECVELSRSDLDFTFITAEKAVSHNTYNKDHTILMTKFINHSVQAKYRKHGNLHYCNGGVSDLKHLLRVIFHKEAA